MIYIKIDNDTFYDDAIVLVRSFYPRMEVKAYKQDTVATEADKVIDITVPDMTGLNKSEMHDKFKSYLYDRLSQMTGKTLPWGYLTGVRPSKIAYVMLEDGEDEQTIKKHYMDKINAIQLPNTKIKILQRLLSQAIDEFKKVNKIMGVEFADRLKKVVEEYNNRRRDEAYANEVLDDVAEQLAQLLSELKTEKNSFKNMGIDYEEKAFYDILKAVSRKFEFEYPDDKMIELSKRIKLIVDDKSRYTDWSARDDIKANLQVDLILLLDEFGYPPVTIDDVYKEVLEQAENFKKYAN